MTSLQAARITVVELTSDRTKPLLVVGPSLGTSVRDLWGEAAALLEHRFHVVGWDLPGHGVNDETSERPGSMAALAHGVLSSLETVTAAGSATPFTYAGDSVGGAVGLQLLVDHPLRIEAAVLACTGARIGTPQSWSERAETVLTQGTEAVVQTSLQRWFTEDFATRRPDVLATFERTLRDIDPAGYAYVCEALAGFDLTSRLSEVDTPLLAVAGEQDQPTPVALLRQIADGVGRGQLVVLPDVAHLAPIEAPAAVARLIDAHLGVNTLHIHSIHQ